MANKPAYKRGKYKPRQEGSKYKGIYKTGSINWFMAAHNVPRAKARQLAKEFKLTKKEEN